MDCQTCVARATKDKEVRRLRLLRKVRSDLPCNTLIAQPRVYDPHEIQINPLGAVSLILPSGVLGIKPDEFEWIGDLTE